MSVRSLLAAAGCASVLATGCVSRPPELPPPAAPLPQEKPSPYPPTRAADDLFQIERQEWDLWGFPR